MAYTPTNWVTGDTVTATKLNKMEQGIAGAGGCASVRISASGFNSGSKIFGYIVYAYLDNNTWVVCSDYDDTYGWITLYGWANPNARLVCIPLPSDDSVGVFLIDIQDENIITGDISTTPTTVYLSSGSIFEGGGNAYRITGNGSYTFVAQ